MMRIALFLFLLCVLVACSNVPTESPLNQTENQDNGSKEMENTALSKSNDTEYDFSKRVEYGDYAYTYWRNEHGRGSIYFYRYFNDSTVHISYWFKNPNGDYVEKGSGDVPFTDVAGSYEEGWFTLKTNTSKEANPGFNRKVGNGGEIAIHWQRTSDWEETGVGAKKKEYADHGSAYKGRWWEQSSITDGILIGYPAGDDNEEMRKFEDIWIKVWEK